MFAQQRLSGKSQTDWWWPLLFLLGLAGLIFWQFFFDKEEPEIAGQSLAKYYLQNPYLVVDVPIPPKATHIGFLDGAAGNRLDLKSLPTEYAVKERSTDKFFVERVTLTSDSSPSLRIWHQAIPLLGVGPTEFRNDQLAWFQDLGLSFWEVVKGDDARRLSNVTIDIPALSEDSVHGHLIKDVDIPLLVPGKLVDLGYPKKFDFGVFAQKVVPAEGNPDPLWQLFFLPPSTIPGRNNVTVTAKRYTVKAGGSRTDVIPSNPSPAPGIGAETAFFPIPVTEVPENPANLFTVEFRRSGVLVGVDAASSCEDEEDVDLQNDCKTIECFIDPDSCKPQPPNGLKFKAANRKLFTRRN
jgi:hypothetical protein